MRIATYVFFVIMSIVFLGLAIYVLLLKNPDTNPTSTCTDINTGQPLPPTWVRPYCLYLNAEYSDPTIPTPTPVLYLGSFTYSDGAGDPLTQPMWYQYQYIRESDGGYGPLSSWTTLPIYSGAPTFPCYPNGTNTNSYCSADGIVTGSGSITFNAPQLVTIQPLDLSISQGYYAIVYRYIGNTDPSTDSTITGTPVGYLLPIPSSSQGWTSYILDVAFNPNS